MNQNKFNIIRGDESQETDSKKSFTPTYVNRRTDEEVSKDLNDLKTCLSKVMGGDLTFNDKMDKILEMNAIIIPEMFREFSSSMPSADKSVVGSRILSAIKDIGSVLIKKRETESSEDIDLSSPKFQMVFTWIIELFKLVLDRQGLDSIQINNIFTDLSSELVGWEEKITKKLKGLSAKVLKEVKNPLVEMLDNGDVKGGFKL